MCVQSSPEVHRPNTYFLRAGALSWQLRHHSGEGRLSAEHLLRQALVRDLPKAEAQIGVVLAHDQHAPAVGGGGGGGGVPGGTADLNGQHCLPVCASIHDISKLSEERV